MIRGINKDVKKLIREAEEKGWQFESTKAGHIRGKHADGVRIVFISGTPSDTRAVHNIRKDLGL